MARDASQTQLEKASAPVIARVRGHCAQLDFPGRGLLEYLLSHVYDTDLSVAAWRRACKVKGAVAINQVRAVVGTTLGAYLEELRVETAMRLLVVSGGELDWRDVGFFVGYEQEEAFRGAFERLTGLTPAAYREQVLALRARGRRLPDPVWVLSLIHI